jgi:hypothetical protein
VGALGAAPQYGWLPGTAAKAAASDIATIGLGDVIPQGAASALEAKAPGLALNFGQKMLAQRQQNQQRPMMMPPPMMQSPMMDQGRQLMEQWWQPSLLEIQARHANRFRNPMMRRGALYG